MRAPRFHRPANTASGDAALTAVTYAAHRASSTVSAALRRAVHCSVGGAVATRFVSDAGCERAWRLRPTGVDIWCVVDAAEHRRLLALVIGGPPAERPTAVERKIVGEVIGRLFADAGDVREERTQRPEGDVWRCDVVVRSDDGPSFSLALCAARVAPPIRPLVVDDPGRVPIDVSATFVVDHLRFADVMSVDAGDLLILGSQHRTHMCLSAGGMIVGSGDIGADGARRAVRLTNAYVGVRLAV